MKNYSILLCEYTLNRLEHEMMQEKWGKKHDKKLSN